MNQKLDSYLLCLLESLEITVFRRKAINILGDLNLYIVFVQLLRYYPFSRELLISLM